MNKYRLDFYRKKDNMGEKLQSPIFWRSQFIDAKNIKEVTIAVSVIENYKPAPFDSDFNYESEYCFVKVLKYDNKKERYI
jgi:hypothetical protein